MKYSITKDNNKDTDLTVHIIEPSDLKKLKFLSKYDTKWLDRVKKAQKFKGEAGNKLFITSPNNTSHFLIMIKKDGAQFMRNAGGEIIKYAQSIAADEIEIIDNELNLAPLYEGIMLGQYSFHLYKDDEKHQISTINLISDRQKSAFTKIIKEAENTVAGISLARDLVNTPGEDMTPMDLKKTAQNIVKDSKGVITGKYLNRKECEKKNMGAFLAVAQGSHSEPVFIHLTYKPKKKAKKKIALVGKGITFDTGGLSLKPAQYMMTMKSDMAGSAAVLGTFKTLAKMDLPLEIHAIIAATDNVPSATAIRPGDVVRASDGQTIEILNTDAEGRLTLADALVYAQKLKVDKIIDLATLTGACVVALGEEVAASYANDEGLSNEIKQASHNVGEDIWPMPLYESYNKLLDSPIANVKNISSSSYGGSITAALFLKRFIKEGQKWSHIDIAGPAFAEKKINSYTEYGGTGFGVLTLLELLKKQA